MSKPVGTVTEAPVRPLGRPNTRLWEQSVVSSVADSGAEVDSGGADVETDWFLEEIETMEKAADQARAALAAVIAALEPARTWREKGAPLVDLVGLMVEGGGRDARRAAERALEHYEHTVQGFRASVIRHLVVDEGLSLSDAARRLHVSRQRAGRLLASAEHGGSTR